MSSVTITITTDNAAFEDGNYGAEVARLLSKAATIFDGTSRCADTRISLNDVNGNLVGYIEVAA